MRQAADASIFVAWTILDVVVRRLFLARLVAGALLGARIERPSP